ncbi:MAG: Bro-N domain-containing protein [Bacteroidetes bacterium]|nr:Bro-N domain-containing protein [Bacteroidota bacterium]
MKTTSQTPQIFSFQKHPLQAHLDEHGNPWFIAMDVCRILGISDVSDAVKRLDPDEKLFGIQPRTGQRRMVNMVNESGLYKLILGSRKPEAKQFTKWVTAEMLPAIRKTGHYEVPGKALPPERKQLPEKRNHNRLDKDRLISILADVCLVRETEVRERLLAKLTGGNHGHY